MNGYWHNGPIIAFWIIVLIIAGLQILFGDNDQEENESEKKPDYELGYVLKTSGFLIYTIVLASIMKMIFGAPEHDVFDVGEMRFWITLVMVATAMTLGVWKSNHERKKRNNK